MTLDIAERVKAYTLNVEQFLEALEKEELPEKARVVVEVAKSYLADSRYYLEKGDYATSLSCIAYAEGLLDALRYQGFVKKADWKPLSQLYKRPRVLVAGSFEFLHPGHIALLEYAWSLGEVHVVVSRDVNFEKFKGRKPALGEQERLRVVSSLKYVASARLGDKEDFLKPIEETKPDIILLGPDQWITPEELRRKLEERGLSNVKIVKYPERVGSWSSSSIYEKLCAHR
ncbi:MAG: DUF357 domain-containing protein [Desulfurococcaceae archaeon]